MVFALLSGLARTQALTYGNGTDETASLEPHTINKATDEDFCTLCLHTSSSFGVGGCRSEFFTKARLRPCGVHFGDKASKSTAESGTAK
ncbi:hypothetical protein T484DRAFT_1943641 [Baffinella frigidus]|nr:hypothetical protein T484DRAFT_1943641 [Cryptophyta sp. CCMP2293]